MSHKTHIFIVIGMVGIMYLLYSLVERLQDYKESGESPDTTLIDETVYIQFEQATFGNNCNGRVMDSSVAERLGVETYGKSGYKRYSVNDNNAISVVSKFCGKVTKCKINVNENTLGFDPAPRCDKNLKLSYRCFNFDIKREAEAPYGGEINIDCSSVSK
jgi:hypothetical protein